VIRRIPPVCPHAEIPFRRFAAKLRSLDAQSPINNC
jgi:hypothetical protein